MSGLHSGFSDNYVIVNLTLSLAEYLVLNKSTGYTKNILDSIKIGEIVIKNQMVLNNIPEDLLRN